MGEEAAAISGGDSNGRAGGARGRGLSGWPDIYNASISQTVLVINYL